MVTGAGGEHGKQIALALAKRGAKLVLQDQFMSNGVKDVLTVVKQAEKFGAKAIGHHMELHKGYKTLVKSAIDQFGRIDILIHCEGHLRMWRMDFPDARLWSRVIRDNLNDTLRLNQEVYNVMEKQGSGKIINFTSNFAIDGETAFSVYNTAKLGVHGVTLAVAQMGETKGISANSVAITVQHLRPIKATDVITEDMYEQQSSQLVLYLASDDCKCNGLQFSSRGNHLSLVNWKLENILSVSDSETPESFADKWKISAQNVAKL